MFRLGIEINQNRARRLATVVAVTVLAIQFFGIAPAAAKYASIVVDGHSGQVLYSRNADTRNYPASLTKMMTLFLLFEAVDEGRFTKASKLKVSARAARQPASKLGLRRGSTITVDQAIRALVIRSANDVAVVVAEALGGTEAKFARLMTAKAHNIGMSKTNFANASGLPNRKQLSTARDMARLAQAIYFTFPHHYHYFSLDSFRWGGRTYRTHNRVVKSYRGADGLKTGYTRASGYNLVTSVERNGRRLIGVVFGGKSSRSRDSHMKRILDKSWPMVKSVEVITPRPKPGTVVTAVNAVRPESVIESQLPDPQPVTKQVAVAGPSPSILPKLRPGGLTVTPGLVLPKSKPFSFVSAPTVTVLRPPEKPAFGDRTITGDWAIQVGAYYDRDKAADAVDVATSKMPSLATNAEEAIVLLKGRKRPIYRARLVGFSEPEARAACKALKKKRVPCIAIKQAKNAVLASAE
ncbi:MAG: D-alanyl-D-alanine carboxypeptidase [Alphaproteobacteria bacterium]|nr:D-alanyl-D-alanine carboxypeptidase [Alphaproteobacteria bacterium]